MSHVWSSIACRAPCMSRHHTRSSPPLLHLFTGYARSTTASKQSARWNHHSAAQWTARPQTASTACSGRHLSTTASSWAAARGSKINNKKQSQRAQPSKTPTQPRAEDNVVAASRTEEVTTTPETLTWRDYDPAGGMPLPDGELTQDEINAVFSSETIDVDVGNYILSVMHWRRLSGALIDVGLDFPKDSGVDREMAMQGLQYVRHIIPDVDESAAGQVWAEEEAQRVRKEYQERALKLGIYKREEDPDYLDEESDQGTELGRERTGTSALQRLRKENEANWESQQRQNAIKAAQQEQSKLHTVRGPLELSGGVQPPAPAEYAAVVLGPNGVAIRSPISKPWLQRVERKPWVKRYEEKATLIKDSDSEAGPELSHLRRFGPSSAVVLLVLAGCVCLSDYYTPPPNSARLWPDIAPSQATLIATSGLLVTTFVLNRFPPMWQFFNKYMCISVKYPYALGVIGAPLRHQTVRHLVSNLAGLWVFGLSLHEDVGRGTFLAVAIASGALGGFTTFAYHALRREWAVWISGASTCAMGVAAAAVTIRPQSNIRVFGYDVPIAAWFIVSLVLVGEVFAALRGLKTGVDHVGHLGGALTGYAAAVYLKSKAKREQMKPVEKPEAVLP